MGVTVLVTGVVATGQIGTVNVWSPINTSQTASWQQIPA